MRYNIHRELELYKIAIIGESSIKENMCDY